MLLCTTITILLWLIFAPLIIPTLLIYACLHHLSPSLFPDPWAADPVHCWGVTVHGSPCKAVAPARGTHKVQQGLQFFQFKQPAKQKRYREYQAQKPWYFCAMHAVQEVVLLGWLRRLEEEERQKSAWSFW